MNKEKFKFKIGDKTFGIENLGEPINTQFLKLHEAYLSGHFFDIKKFEEESFNFFSTNNDYTAHDKFFNNFTIIWQHFLSLRRFDKAEELWNLTLDIAYEWEKVNQGFRIHKGTPYYFWGVTCILNNELDKGFLLMHQALEEDKKTHSTLIPLTPAYHFVTLNPTEPLQFFRAKVIEIANFIETQLGTYRSKRGGNLTFADFQSKFLRDPNLQEAVFDFVFTTFRLKKLLVEIDQKLTQNVFSSLLQANVIFDLCLIVDAIIRNKNPDPDKWRFIDQLAFLSSQSSLSLDTKKLGELNKDFDSDFSNALQKLLNSNYKFGDGSSLQQIEEDLGITYGFRNFGAHRIEAQPIIYEKFEEISQRIVNALFFSIEKLYP